MQGDGAADAGQQKKTYWRASFLLAFVWVFVPWFLISIPAELVGDGGSSYWGQAYYHHGWPCTFLYSCRGSRAGWPGKLVPVPAGVDLPVMPAQVKSGLRKHLAAQNELDPYFDFRFYRNWNVGFDDKWPSSNWLVEFGNMAAVKQSPSGCLPI